MYKDIIKALLAAKVNAPSYENWDGESKIEVKAGSTTIRCNAHTKAIEGIIARYEKGKNTPNFQNQLKWARNDTRNYKQREIKNPAEYGFQLI